MTLQELGRFDEAEASLRQMIALNPDSFGAWDNLLFMLNYDPRLSSTELYREYEAYGAFVSSKTVRGFDHSNRPSIAGRRIRVGYSSPDFRAHACRFFMEPMLREHDRDQFELFAYSNTKNPDRHTERLKGYFDQWIDVTQLSDEAMAQRIYDDGIDILVDMSGHTKGNRLLAFAMCPAPIQVGSAIGYGYTTGLKEIDYFIGDENLTPEVSEPYFSEKLFRVPAPIYVYEPPRDITPDVSDLPALRNGYVTFGSLTRTIRLNDPLLKTWKKILDRVPGSRLRLDQKPFAAEGMRELFWQRLEGLGIPRERVELTCSQPHWLAYQDIDITLDCWPHNAGTTTIESLWMGVPVLSKMDRPSMGCVGASILKPLDLEDWVVEDEAAYIEKAADYASDLTALSKLRGDLRQRLEKSSLLDAAACTQKIEAAYRQMLAKRGQRKL
jgi:predicted O-linked N-acetylglucosamine transferase (SPINDLY family)